MKKTLLIVFIVSILAGLLTGCAGQSSGQVTMQENVTKVSKNGLETTSTDTQTSAEQSAVEQTQEQTNTAAVVLKVYSDATATDKGNPGTEYTLSDEQSAFIKELFYDHEKNILDSPLMCIGTVEIQVGNDILSTSIGGLSVLDGVIDGKYVMVELSDSERQQLQELIATYVTYLTLVP